MEAMSRSEVYFTPKNTLKRVVGGSPARSPRWDPELRDPHLPEVFKKEIIPHRAMAEHAGKRARKPCKPHTNVHPQERERKRKRKRQSQVQMLRLVRSFGAPAGAPAPSPKPRRQRPAPDLRDKGPDTDRYRPKSNNVLNNRRQASLASANTGEMLTASTAFRSAAASRRKNR